MNDLVPLAVAREICRACTLLSVLLPQLVEHVRRRAWQRLRHDGVRKRRDQPKRQERRENTRQEKGFVPVEGHPTPTAFQHRPLKALQQWRFSIAKVGW
ncbi:MAG: hypothetical protein V4559_14800 [Pseudomonadota bacterium]